MASFKPIQLPSERESVATMSARMHAQHYILFEQRAGRGL